MAVTFAVDAVELAANPLPTRPWREAAKHALALGGDPELPVIDHGPTHPLLGAVSIAFAQHRPLVLSPDAIWLTIAQGVAQHVRLNAERLRPRLVRHAGKERLTVEVAQVPTDAAGWAAVVPQFRDALAGRVGEGRARLFECDFSTSTEVDRVASQIVLLDAYAPYFDYWLLCICGIPSITLTGTANDWRRIRERIDVIAELELEHWTRSLAPILDHFVCAAEGRADPSFWQRIYNPVDAYGGAIITGWITRLYPYLTGGGYSDIRNSMLDLPIDEPRNLTRKRTTGPLEPYAGPGIRSDQVPAGPSVVNIRVVDEGTTITLALEGGVMAVAQDSEGRLAPIAGWSLRPGAPLIGEILDRIRAEHEAVPAPPRDATERSIEAPAEVVALYHELDRATLFGGRWKIRPWAKRSDLTFTNRRDLQGHILIDLIDLPYPQHIAYSRGREQLYWFLCRIQPGSDPPQQEVIPIGTSLAEILDRALATNGEPPPPVEWVEMFARNIRRT